MLSNNSDMKCEHEDDGIIYKKFGSRYEGLDCRIPYMKCKKCGELYVCEHEPDDKFRHPDELVRCKKCGEFYK